LSPERPSPRRDWASPGRRLRIARQATLTAPWFHNEALRSSRSSRRRCSRHTRWTIACRSTRARTAHLLDRRLNAPPVSGLSLLPLPLAVERPLRGLQFG